MMRFSFGLIALTVPLVAQAGDACSCAPGNRNDDEGVVWVGRRAPSLQEIAEVLAPVLWYTADEPAIGLGRTPLPHAYPCDEKKDGVLYYQVNWLVKRGERGLNSPVEEDPQFGEKVSKLGLRYYFYHDFDYGLNPHRHDLEMAELRATIENPSQGCYQVRLTDTIAFAHGTEWYSNELLTTPDTKLPITLMIEEGKHASAPDRNADGLYTPGYDVNVRVNDAWGVRDVLGSGYLISSQYQGFMTKRRTDRTRVLPPRTENACVKKMLHSIRSEQEYLYRYELRPGYRVGLCRNVENYAHLEKWTRYNQFGNEYEPPQYGSDLSEALSKPVTGRESWYPKVAVRYDNKVGFAFTLNGIDLTEFYLVPRFAWVPRRTSLDLLITRSATGFVGPYVALGFGRERQSETDPLESNFVTEGGVKLRLLVDWPWRILGAGYEFAGIRIGVRQSGFDEIQNFRFIIEFGAGLW